ncbi:hypothetical protein [Neisseria shayeganii]|nr:hypothetical protein [Neisseria shayeganii]
MLHLTIQTLLLAPQDCRAAPDTINTTAQGAECGNGATHCGTDFDDY